jgi:hypothetical protein
MQCSDEPNPTGNFQGSLRLLANIPPSSPPVSLHCNTYARTVVPLRDNFFSLYDHMPISTFRLSAAKHFTW